MVCERQAFHEQYLRDGNLDPEHAPPIGFAHLSTYAEFRALFAPEFGELALAGVESFSAAGQPTLNDWRPRSPRRGSTLSSEPGRQRKVWGSPITTT